jgi:hypothetical protein
MTLTNNNECLSLLNSFEGRIVSAERLRRFLKVVFDRSICAIGPRVRHKLALYILYVCATLSHVRGRSWYVFIRKESCFNLLTFPRFIEKLSIVIGVEKSMSNVYFYKNIVDNKVLYRVLSVIFSTSRDYLMSFYLN